MRYVKRLFYTLILWAAMSGGVFACAYPNAFRVVNDTLNDQLVRGGEVSQFVRHTLRRALDQMPAESILTSMQGQLGRGDLRAARRVLAVAGTLADGRGVTVDPDLRSDTMRLREAVEQDCANGTLDGNGTGEATGVDGGGERKAGGVGRALTFKEGMTRLSIAFTLYAVFLLALFAFRQFYRRHYETPTDEDAKPPLPDLRAGTAAKTGARP